MVAKKIPVTSLERILDLLSHFVVDLKCILMVLVGVGTCSSEERHKSRSQVTEIMSDTVSYKQ